MELEDIQFLFAQNGFNTYAFDLSEEAVNATKKWAEELKFKCRL